MSEINIGDRVEKLMSEPTTKDLSTLQQADDFYNSLVAKGLIKKRGYTLLGIEDRPTVLNIGLNKQAEKFTYQPVTNL